MYIHQENLRDDIGIISYSEEHFFDLECRVMPWNNDKIRINYLIGQQILNKKVIGKFIDTRDYNYTKPKKREDLTIYKESEDLIFSLSSNYKNEIIIDYDPILNGLRTFTALFTTDEPNGDKDNGYNWEYSLLWDEFWFRNTTRILLMTEAQVLGKQ